MMMAWQAGTNQETDDGREAGQAWHGMAWQAQPGYSGMAWQDDDDDDGMMKLMMMAETEVMMMEAGHQTDQLNFTGNHQAGRLPGY
ncbi:hypothetical protein ACO1D0_00590 [Bacillus licheniformis]|uniref:hypothetical protein n=1 Tax=Bacillus licheniformis TaxID=1402 RepID=UPI003BF70B54